MSASEFPIQVREHDTLVRAEHHSPAWTPNITALDPEFFDAVQEVLVDPQFELAPAAQLTRFEGQPALKLQEWVGIIRTPDGQAIEILPKTHERPGRRTEADSLDRSRALLLRMLAATHENFRVGPPAEMQTLDMPLYEVVIGYALHGIRAAVRRGVPHTYVAVEEERPSLRGRLDLPKQVRQPPHRAHLLHVVYDEFLPDRPESRLTRLAVERLAKLTRMPSSQRLARELLHALDEVPPSRNLSADFAAWRLGRGHTHFAPLESICRMVLYELNPVASGPGQRANALLFNMNALYEAYVAQLLRQVYPDWQVETQVTDRALGQVGGQGAFDVRPDLLLRTSKQQIIVADTKWKRLSSGPPIYGVSNVDAYQMLAYSEVFQKDAAEAERRELWLLYPRLPHLPAVSEPIELGAGRTLRIVTVDLEAAEAENQWPREQLTMLKDRTP